jgi:hypothetical protein
VGKCCCATNGVTSAGMRQSACRLGFMGVVSFRAVFAGGWIDGF